MPNERPSETVSLGFGSRSSFTEVACAPQPQGPHGLLYVPPVVDAELRRQQAKHVMTPEYCQTLRDRLTLTHYFSGVEVAFRRTRQGIEVVAAGFDEIAEFRRASTPEQLQGIVYGVG
jgi:hypothetical protein